MISGIGFIFAVYDVMSYDVDNIHCDEANSNIYHLSFVYFLFLYLHTNLDEKQNQFFVAFLN